MTSSEILHEIITADQEARAIYEEAARKQDSLEDSIKNRIADIRLEYFKSADEAIAKHEAEEIRAADLAIQRNDEKLRVSLESAAKFFEENKENAVDRIFKIAVGIDA